MKNPIDEHSMENKSLSEMKVWKSDTMVDSWRPDEVYRSLITETDIHEDAARIVAKEVEKLVKSLNLDVITAPLIRELTNAKLVEYGLERVRRQHTRIGLPFYDAKKLLTSILLPPLYPIGEVPKIPPVDTSGSLWNPPLKNVDTILAMGIKKEFSLLDIYTDSQVRAHMEGTYYIHNLGHPDRFVVLTLPVGRVLKYGIVLPGMYPISPPPGTIYDALMMIHSAAAHMLSSFAISIELPAMNYYLAPYIQGLDDDEITRVARILLYSLSSLSYTSTGWKIPPVRISLHANVPEYLNEDAIGPGGKDLGIGYGDYSDEANKLMKAILTEYSRGDNLGRPFFAPEIDLVPHGMDWEEINAYSKLGGITIHINDDDRLNKWYGDGYTEKINSVVEIVTVNMPRVAYMADGSDEVLSEVLGNLMIKIRDIFARKTEYMRNINALSSSVEPMGLVGIFGLREAVKYHTGSEITDESALDAAAEMIETINGYLTDLSDELGMPLKTTEFGNILLGDRFLRMDKKLFPLQSSTVSTNSRGYTHSHYVGIDEVDLRMKISSRIHPLIGFYPHTRVFRKSIKSPKESLGKWSEDGIRTVRILRHLTACMECGRTMFEKAEKCEFCHSANVQVIRY